MIQPRSVIVSEECSSATIIELNICANGIKTMTNSAINILLNKEASLNYFCLQLGLDSTLQFNNINISQSEQSNFSGTVIQTGGEINRTSLEVNLNEPQAKCNFYAMEFANKKQNIDMNIVVNHNHSLCESKITSRGVSAGRATTSFTGRIIVKEASSRTIAHLENKNLILSNEAEANTRPQLEIYNDDVKCSHGATVGHIDVEALFYLRCRGISEKEAKRLLVEAFIWPSLNNIPDELMQYVNKLYHEL